MHIKKTLAGIATALALSAGWCVPTQAAVVAVANPNQSSDIGARIRWGATGFEASLYDSNPLDQTPTLNPGGTPVWQPGLGYGFRFSFDGATGTLGLGVDFNRDGMFGLSESISRSVFAAPGLVSYQGYGFNFLQISGNESGSAARSTLTNLTINGEAMGNIAPNGSLLDTYFANSNGNPFDPINISGTLTFTSITGAAQERPSWNIRLISPEEAAVPEPGSMALAALGLAGLVATRRRKAR